MNNFGTELIYLALQTTIFSLAVILLHVLLSRRGPRESVYLLAGSLALLLLLPGLLLLPLPHGWTVAAQSANTVSSGAVGSAPGNVSAAENGPAASKEGESVAAALPVDMLWRQLSTQLQKAQSSHPLWPAVGAWCFLAGLALALGRVVFGLVMLFSLRRQCQRIDDELPRQLADGLKKNLGLRKDVELCETTKLRSAATVGWLHPIILLPTHWRCWSEKELGAVLAHELAHIRRGDFLIRLLAQCSCALHFYQPLVYWLSRRLYLQQELAADALGARAAGDRHGYLVALSRLALREDGWSGGGLAQSFLPARGTLMRRIDMLQARERLHRPWPARVLRTVALLLMVSAALAVSTLRSPSGLQAQEATGDNGKTKAVSGTDAIVETRKPLDLTYLSEDTHGVIAVRLAAIFGRPDMKDQLQSINEGYTKALKLIGLKAGLGLPVEEIDELTCSLFLRVREGNAPEGRGTAEVGIQAIRAAHKFDWKKQVQRMFPKVAEVHFAGQVYFKLPGDFKHPLFAKTCFYVPDDRTLVMQTEQQIRNLIQKKNRPRIVPHWRQVESGLIAVYVKLPPDVRAYLLQKKSLDRDPELHVWKHVDSVTIGFDGEKEISWHAFCHLSNETDTADAEKTARKCFAHYQQNLAKLLKKRDGQIPARYVGVIQSALRLCQPRIERSGLNLELSARAEFPLALFFEAYQDFQQ